MKNREMRGPGERSKLNIETVEGPEGIEVSLCPDKGGIITSIKVKGKEILRQDPHNFEDPDYKMRGGIPILFPNAGPLKEGGPYLLKQHGFVRDSDKWSIERDPEGKELVEIFEADEETKKAFGYDFLLKMKIRIEEDGSVSLIQEVTNREKEKEMPVSMGLHPYFQIPEGSKREMLVSLIGKERADEEFENWLKGNAISIDNPGKIELSIPGVGLVEMSVSKEYEKIFIWTQPGQDFVCVEPFMRDVGGLVDNPELIDPGESISAEVNFCLKESSGVAD